MAFISPPDDGEVGEAVLRANHVEILAVGLRDAVRGRIRVALGQSMKSDRVVRRLISRSFRVTTRLVVVAAATSVVGPNGQISEAETQVLLSHSMFLSLSLPRVLLINGLLIDDSRKSFFPFSVGRLRRRICRPRSRWPFRCRLWKDDWKKTPIPIAGKEKIEDYFFFFYLACAARLKMKPTDSISFFFFFPLEKSISISALYSKCIFLQVGLKCFFE